MPIRHAPPPSPLPSRGPARDLTRLSLSHDCTHPLTPPQRLSRLHAFAQPSPLNPPIPMPREGSNTPLPEPRLYSPPHSPPTIPRPREGSNTPLLSHDCTHPPTPLTVIPRPREESRTCPHTPLTTPPPSFPPSYSVIPAPRQESIPGGGDGVASYPLSLRWERAGVRVTPYPSLSFNRAIR